MRPSNGGETLIATNTFFLAAFEQGEFHADVIPTANGFYEFRAVVSVVDPPDSNLANNQCTWIVPCGSGSLFSDPTPGSCCLRFLVGGRWPMTAFWDRSYKPCCRCTHNFFPSTIELHNPTQ